MKKDLWLINNACSNHLTSDESQFTTLDRSYGSKVEIVDGSFLRILGKGTVAVETQQGKKFISNVYFVLDANQNLLSVGQLTQNNYDILFKDKFCTIFDPKGEEILTVEIRNKCYPIDWQQSDHAFFSCVNDSELWHNRFGHVNFSSLQTMVTKELVTGLPKIAKPDTVCKIC
ncbi:Uncharacterized protein TCM_045387 [Theobroma cacao]|uniref:Uncharacterized protein n=1 Tax=Theobroma cacao TaxID=3641 RepID=A0A061FSS0_THECC|nr:Uncharacterized protein TCM_045387 [Theobroma cacao]